MSNIRKKIVFWGFVVSLLLLLICLFINLFLFIFAHNYHETLRKIFGILVIISFVAFAITSFIIQKETSQKRNSKAIIIKNTDNHKFMINIHTVSGKFLYIAITIIVSLLYFWFSFYAM